METFCNSSFWDPGITWYTKDPDFTACFEKTALLWPTCGFLWITALLDIYRLSDPYYNQPLWKPVWTWKGTLKMGVIVLVILLEASKLIFDWVNWVKDRWVGFFTVPPVVWTDPLVLIATHTLSGFLIVLHKSRCVHTSGIQLLYWSLVAGVTGLVLRTEYREFIHRDRHTTPILFVSLSLQGVIFVLSLLQAFLFCLTDIPASISKVDHPRRKSGESKRSKLPDCPLNRCSSLSLLFFSWSTPFLQKCYKTAVTSNDLWDLLPSLKSTASFKIFQREYGPPSPGKRRSIFRNILLPFWRTSGSLLSVSLSCKMISTLLGYLTPTVMGFIIDFVQDKTIEVWKGYLWAGCLLLISWLVCLFLEQYYFYMYQASINAFSCLNMMVYKKCLRVSPESRKLTTSGQLVNLMSVDVEKIRYLLLQGDAIWSSPIQLVLGVVLLWKELGVAVFPGLAVLCATVPVTWWLSAKSNTIQHAVMQKKDERIKVTTEVLSGIQVVKMYTWEPPFQRQIETVRSEEVGFLRRRSVFQIGIQLVMESVPFLVSAASFFTFVFLNGETLDPKKAFAAVILFNLLTEPITEFPSTVSAIIDARVSFTRVNDFLNAAEIPDDTTKWLPRSQAPNSSTAAVEIVNGTFYWEEETESSVPWKLVNINLRVEPGTLTAVVGSVASGKSSLLSAIFGEMKLSGPPVTVRGKVAYVSQIPWIQNTTLRDNICFGQPYNEEKYGEIVEACGLSPDIARMPAGDETEIGEKGINLSGGQKQRLSLARAVYSDADVLLLDDVLSAVDNNVGKHIFDKLLGHSGLLRGKTRILCTHACQYLPQVDTVVVLENGQITERGSYQELMTRSGRLTHLMQTYLHPQELQAAPPDSDSPSDRHASAPGPSGDPSSTGTLVETEEMESGDVKMSVILSYVKTMGYSWTTLFLLFFGASQAFSLGRNVILSKWTNAGSSLNASTLSTSDRNTYAVTYGVFGVCQSIAYFLGYYLLFCVCTIRATKHLHNNMLHRILHAPMRFFNVTPLGRITNRFSADVEKLDHDLPWQLGEWLAQLYKFLTVIVALIFATNVYFLVYMVPVALLYYFLQRYYVVCMQQLERIRSVSRSPIYAQFQETLNGTSTLRAFQAEGRFLKILGRKVDAVNRADFPHLIVRRWLSIRLGFLGSTVVFIPALFAIWWRDTIDPSMVGLSISYAVQMTEIVSWLIKLTSYVRYTMVGAERILEYSQVEQEASFHQGKREAPPKWPSKGEITFKDYGTRYRPELGLVLKQFTCRIAAGEKVGIVGRTGAGKSSLTLGLFRILEAAQGEIQIDGVNIAELGLHQVRKILAVIPQEPVLFSRSLRLNLDPFEEFSDDRLWQVLEMACLKKYVAGLEGQLSFGVAEGGENLSVGHRQLVCLARAILRKSPILILDEATSSVDSETDALIQTTIRDHFGRCTVLNVAHRLNTVLDSNRILVLDHGQVAEFDTPQNLLMNPDSIFYSMARNAGIIKG